MCTYMCTFHQPSIDIFEAFDELLLLSIGSSHAGMDARAAAIVMRTVRNVVNTGRTIVCTIHQPSIDIFEALDQLLLLSSGSSHAGLDARAAAIVMRTVRNIVNTGRTIVCTIHQPSIDIFEAFDELLLLKRGGELIFNGQLGNKSKHLVKYFSVSS